MACFTGFTVSIRTMAGKTYIDNRGYRRFKDTDKLVHRWVVEKSLGHRLPAGAVVHHINRRKRDNRLKNLKVYKSQSEHAFWAHGIIPAQGCTNSKVLAKQN